MNTDFSLKVQDAITSDMIIYPEMDISRTVLTCLCYPCSTVVGKSTGWIQRIVLSTS